MTMAAFCRIVQTRWENLSSLLWPPSADQLTHAEVSRLTDELEGRYSRLLRRRLKIEQLRDRLAGLERAEAWVGPGDAALRAIERTRDRLAEHEEQYERQRLAFLRVKRLRRALTRGQVVVCPRDEAVPE
jgi:hypothetical protein